jgi:Zn-dependent protease
MKPGLSLGQVDLAPSIPRVFGIDAFYLGHFGRVPVYLRFDVLILAAWILTMSGSLTYRLIVLFVLLMTVLMHELGHAAVATARGMQGVKVVITGMGGFCTYNGLPSPQRELTISVAGPLMNFTLAGFAWLALRHLDMSELVYLIVRLTYLINLYLGIINSLPIYPFDGGQALLSLLRIRMSPRRAGGIVLTTSFITAILALGVVTWYQGGQIPWLLVMFVVVSLFQASRDLR